MHPGRPIESGALAICPGICCKLPEVAGHRSHTSRAFMAFWLRAASCKYDVTSCPPAVPMSLPRSIMAMSRIFTLVMLRLLPLITCPLCLFSSSLPPSLPLCLAPAIFSPLSIRGGHFLRLCHTPLSTLPPGTLGALTRTLIGTHATIVHSVDISPALLQCCLYVSDSNSTCQQKRSAATCIPGLLLRPL